jgi:hypothetical protein
LSTPVQITLTHPSTESVQKKKVILARKHPSHKVAHALPKSVRHLQRTKAHASAKKLTP